MKNLLLILTIMTLNACSKTSGDHPSDAEITELLKEKGAIEVRFTSEEGTVHSTVTEKWYERTAESKWKTDVDNVFRWERSDYRYDFVGDKWVFNRSYFGSGWYDGVPNPTEEEIVKILHDSRAGYQGAYVEKPIFKLAEDPKFNWHTFNSVEFMVEATYYKKLSYTEFQKVKATFPVRLYKDCGGGVYNNSLKEVLKDAAWLPVRIYTISTDYGKEEIIETKTLNSTEAGKVQSMLEVYGY